MTSTPVYYENTYQFSDIANIESVGKDDRGSYIILDRTIFYPQGGGQPSDQGYLKLGTINIPINSVKMVEKEIRHYTDQEYKEAIGQIIYCYIDQDKRILHAKCHSAGHLISNIIEEIYPDYKAVKGHHFPGECYVEFIAKDSNLRDMNLALLTQKIAEAISENQSVKSMFVTNDQLTQICPALPYEVPKNQFIRVVRLGNFGYQPCGGTHVATLSELKECNLTKFKIKNDMLKIYYTMEG